MDLGLCVDVQQSSKGGFDRADGLPIDLWTCQEPTAGWDDRLWVFDQA